MSDILGTCSGNVAKFKKRAKTYIRIAFLAPQGVQDEAKMQPRRPKLGARCPKMGDDGIKIEAMSPNISKMNCNMRLKSAVM